MKKPVKITLSVILGIIIALFINGVYYVFWGQEKSVAKLDRGQELNLYECCSIYTMHMAATAFSGILSPEAAHQCFLMMFGKEGGFYTKETNFWKSSYISNTIFKAGNNQCVIDFPLNEITSNPNSKLRHELRYALAFDSAIYKPVYENDPLRGILYLDVKYDSYTAKYDLGFIKLVFHWRLLAYIQDLGWLKKVHITYIWF